MNLSANISYLLVAALFFLIACGKEGQEPETRDTFVYTFMSPDSAFSLKFNESDTVYLKNYKNESEAYALLKNRDSLDALIREVDFEIYDSLYEKKFNPYVEATGIRFYRKSETTKQSITMIQDGPEALYKIAIRLNEYAKRLDFNSYRGKQDYGSLGILVPPPPTVEIQEAPQSKQKDLQFK